VEVRLPNHRDWEAATLKRIAADGTATVEFEDHRSHQGVTRECLRMRHGESSAMDAGCACH
jgi:hypothetical protein